MFSFFGPAWRSRQHNNKLASSSSSKKENHKNQIALMLQVASTSICNSNGIIT